MKESTLKIKSMVTGCLFGRMGGNMKGNGKMGNSMGREFILWHRRKRKLGFGLKGKGKIG